ncbi:transposase [Agrobacterium rosae]|uniref:transposase n=1 Tax=Agrobacterium rosae TaxID=1972867 RepID=UPI00387B8028
MGNFTSALLRKIHAVLTEQAVAEAREPGASVSAIEHRIGIHPSQLFGWRRDALERERSASSGAAVCTQAGSGGPNSVIDVVIGDVVIRDLPDVDAAHLQRLIRAVLSA